MNQMTKNGILFLLAILLSNPFFAQTTQKSENLLPEIARITQHLSQFEFEATGRNPEDRLRGRRYDIWADDSWLFYDSIQFKYDAEDQLIEETFRFYADGAWQNNYRTVYEYDANGNKIFESEQTWYDSEWQYCSHTLFEYDANNRPTKVLYQDLYDTEWINNYQLVFSYDSRHNLSTKLKQNWNLTAGQWENDWRQSFDYNSEDLNVSLIREGWENGDWENISRGSFAYDAAGNLVQEKFKYWNGSSWENSVLITYAYENTDLLTLFRIQSWDDIAWTNELQDILVYTAEGQLSHKLRQVGYYTDVWYNSSQEFYSYDSQGNLQHRLDQFWDFTAWDDAYRYLHEYDADNNLIYTLGQEWCDEWHNFEQIVYHYGSYTGYSETHPEFWQFDVAVTPGPGNGIFEVEVKQPIQMGGTVKVFDINGQLLLFGEFENTDDYFKLDMTDFPAGTYFVVVQAGTDHETQALVLKR